MSELRTGPGGVRIAITRDPALVRTVRLVAAAVARRTGRDEDFVEEVRLAVGEACALLLGDEPVETAEPVSVEIGIADRLRVRVHSESPVDVADPPHSDIDGVEPWTLLRGLIDDFDVQQDGRTTQVSMSWALS